MIIKDSPKDHILVAKSRNIFSRTFQNKTLLTVVLILLLFGYSVFLFLLGVKTERSGFISNVLLPTIRENYRVPLNYVQGLLTNPERIILDIKFKAYQKLEYQRARAFERGMLLLDENDYVKARIRHDGKTYKIKLRLKGDTTDHLQGDKWSFRVKMRGENTLWGMKQFSLQHPRHRNYIYEWIYHQALCKVGVISLRYKFVEVSLNGKALGVYAIEEHFEKRLIENNRLREGPIVRFTEDIYWDTYHWKDFRQRFDTEAYLCSDIDAFQTTKVHQNPVLYQQFLKAMSLLESFRRGELKTSEVFDVEKLAKFVAIADLLGGRHCNRWHNKKFYYNPVTAKLEPIGFDSMPGARIASLSCDYTDWFEGFLLNRLHQETLFSDPLFFEQYAKALAEISDPSFLDELFAEINDSLEKNLRILYREFPYYSNLFSKDVLYHNQAYIRKVLNPTRGLNAYLHDYTADEITLELGNVQSLPIQITGVLYKGLVLSSKKQIILRGRKASVPMTYTRGEFLFPDNSIQYNIDAENLKVMYTIPGTGRQRHETVFPWPHFDPKLLENDLLRQPPNAHLQEWLAVDNATKRITVKPGTWNIDHSVIFPEGYTVIAQGDITLNLLNRAVMVFYSPIKLIGLPDKPLTIDASGGGQGLVVLSAAAPSLFKHVLFKGLSAPAQAGWALTGAVTLYESPVVIYDSRFVDCQSEDALNVIRSDFSIEKSLFENSASDSLDTDFCTGTIVNSSFVNCGNDCVDVSGTEIDVQDSFINGCGDKGLSAGESSRMSVNHVKIQNTEIAVASKDRSLLVAESLEIRNSRIGLTVYQKKPEFGPATIKTSTLSLESVALPFLVEEKSCLIAEGKNIQPNRENVKEILYGAEYGKSSR